MWSRIDSSVDAHCLLLIFSFFDLRKTKGEGRKGTYEYLARSQNPVQRSAAVHIGSSSRQLYTIVHENITTICKKTAPRCIAESTPWTWNKSNNDKNYGRIVMNNNQEQPALIEILEMKQNWSVDKHNLRYMHNTHERRDTDRSRY